eukprot:gene15774-21897_t
MATNTVYKGLDGETTEWDDIQRKLGNFVEKAPAWKPEKFTPKEDEPTGRDLIDNEQEEELSDMEDEFGDDRAMEEYRRKRLEELRKVEQRPRFRGVEDIRGSEFVQKVTNDSKEGICVVVHLYKDGHGPSGLMGKCLEDLSAKYVNTKFVKIVSTDCIPKYPDSNLPTILLYRDGTCQQHLVGLQQFGGSRMNPEFVALTLNKYGPYCLSNTEADEEAEATQQRCDLSPVTTSALRVQRCDQRCDLSPATTSALRVQRCDPVQDLLKRMVQDRLEKGKGSDDESSDFDDI